MSLWCPDQLEFFAISQSDTIYALSSGCGKAGVAVVRVSGGKAGECIVRACGALPAARVASVMSIRRPSTAEKLDRGLVLWFPAPASFTGEDVAEFHLHGSVGVVRLFLDELRLLDDVRPAEAGEFSRRAFENGKLDLVEVEGLSDMLEAETAAQVRQALFHVDGDASQVFAQWRSAISAALAFVEASIDFADEEGVDAAARTEIAQSLAQTAEALTQSLQSFERGRRTRLGARVVLIGAPNAGKSSLLNAIAARDVAIVSREAGTTRDVVEVSLDLNGHAVELADTAGIREQVDSEPERIGIERSRMRASEADLVLLIASEGADWPEIELDSETIRIWSKSDLGIGTGASVADHVVSARTGEGVAGLIDEVARRLGLQAQQQEPALLVRERQMHAVETCLLHVERAMSDSLELELVAEELRFSARALERLIGRIDVEDLLDAIFSRFCIGK